MKNRPERKISFLVVWLTMFSCISGNGQILLKKADLTPDFKHLWLPGANADLRANNGLIMGGCLAHLDRSWGVVVAKTETTNREYRSTGSLLYAIRFLLQKEWELEKATHIPFRFRLGSLADCDAMEGKH